MFFIGADTNHLMIGYFFVVVVSNLLSLNMKILISMEGLGRLVRNRAINYEVVVI
tara:strand:- start:2 stop:166 length:165 start_codon:yes stop_codon:yes gene_type:complete